MFSKIFTLWNCAMNTKTYGKYRPKTVSVVCVTTLVPLFSIFSNKFSAALLHNAIVTNFYLR